MQLKEAYELGVSKIENDRRQIAKESLEGQNKQGRVACIWDNDSAFTVM